MMNRLIFKYIDEENAGTPSDETIRISKPIPANTHCATIVRAFKGFLDTMGYAPETIERYINVANIYNDIDDYHN